MGINLSKRTYLFYLTLLTILSGGVGGVVYYTLMPEHYFGAYPFIPLYFYIFGVFRIYMFDACGRYAPDKMLLLQLAIKVLRMILSIVLLLTYCIQVRDGLKEFLLTFIVYYLVYLIFDTCFFLSYELKKKVQKNKELKNETIA